MIKLGPHGDRETSFPSSPCRRHGFTPKGIEENVCRTQYSGQAPKCGKLFSSRNHHRLGRRLVLVSTIGLSPTVGATKDFPAINASTTQSLQSVLFIVATQPNRGTATNDPSHGEWDPSFFGSPNFKTSNGPDVQHLHVGRRDAMDNAKCCTQAAFHRSGDASRGTSANQNYTLGSDLLDWRSTAYGVCGVQNVFSKNFGPAPWNAGCGNQRL